MKEWDYREICKTRPTISLRDILFIFVFAKNFIFRLRKYPFYISLCPFFPQDGASLHAR